MDESRSYTVHEVIAAECTLEPLRCIHCGNVGEVTFLQSPGDAHCAVCGKWQLEGEEGSSTKIQCILDLCPADGEFVDHRKCCHCQHQNGEQPDFGWEECSHPEAQHSPDLQRWQDLKSVGSEVLSVTLVSRRYSNALAGSVGRSVRHRKGGQPDD